MSKHEVYVNKQLNDALQVVADRKKITKAAALNEILVSVGVGNEEMKPVVLQIPVSLLNGNEESLRNWLHARSNGIVNHFYPTKKYGINT